MRLKVYSKMLYKFNIFKVCKVCLLFVHILMIIHPKHSGDVFSSHMSRQKRRIGRPDVAEDSLSEAQCVASVAEPQSLWWDFSFSFSAGPLLASTMSTSSAKLPGKGPKWRKCLLSGKLHFDPKPPLKEGRDRLATGWWVEPYLGLWALINGCAQR